MNILNEKPCCRRLCKMQGTLDGGLSWLIVLSSFMQQFIVLGTHNVFGLFYIDLLKEFKGGKAITALAGSISFGLCFFLGPITAALCHKCGTRAAALSGTIILALGLLLTSFVGDLPTMYLTYSLVVAMGSSLCYFSSILILEEYFSRLLVTSNGVALCGAGVGTLVLSPVVEQFLSIYKWRITMRILSGFASLLLVCSVAHFFVVAPKQSLGDDAKENISKTKLVDTSLFKNNAYVVWIIVVSLVLFGFYIPYVHLVRHCLNLAIPKQKGSILVGYLAISQTIGKVVFGRIADHPRVHRIYLLQYALLVCGIATTLLPICTSYGTITVYCWVFGFHDGCFVLLIAVLTGDVVGREKLGVAIGMMYFFSSISMTIGPPFAGILYGITGTYNPIFFMSGAFTILGVCLLFSIPMLLPPQIIEQWEQRSKVKEVTLLSLETDGNSKALPEDKTTYVVEKVITDKIDNCYVISSKSGSRRLVTNNTLSLPEQQNDRFSWIDRYFSMEHLMEQKDCLISRVYSRENLFAVLPAESSNVRETDV